MPFIVMTIFALSFGVRGHIETASDVSSRATFWLVSATVSMLWSNSATVLFLVVSWVLDLLGTTISLFLLVLVQDRCVKPMVFLAFLFFLTLCLVTMDHWSLVSALWLL